MSKIRTWVSIGAIAVVVVVAGAWYFAISPQSARAANRNAQAASEQQKVRVLQGQLALLKKQQAQVPAEQASIDAASSNLPSDPALPAYIRALYAAALATHVELVSVAPSEPAPAKPAAGGQQPSPSPAAHAGTTPSAAALPLDEITLNMQLVGDYFALQQFMSKLEGMRRITVVSNITLTPGQGPQPQTTSTASAQAQPANTWRTLQAQVTAAIFMSPMVGGPSAKPSASASASAAPSPQPSSTKASN